MDNLYGEHVVADLLGSPLTKMGTDGRNNVAEKQVNVFVSPSTPDTKSLLSCF